MSWWADDDKDSNASDDDDSGWGFGELLDGASKAAAAAAAAAEDVVGGEDEEIDMSGVWSGASNLLDNVKALPETRRSLFKLTSLEFMSQASSLAQKAAATAEVISFQSRECAV